MPSLLAAGDIRLTIFESKRMEPVASVSSAFLCQPARGRTLRESGRRAPLRGSDGVRTPLILFYRGLFSH
jgi:hypothetical protein